MKFSLLFCFLSLFLAVSCGSDNDDNDNGTVNMPTNEDDRENEDDTAVSKYTSVRLNANGFFDDLYEHSLRLDLGRRPVIMAGSYSSTPENGTKENCTFQFTVTDAQANKLETLGNRLKVCTHVNNTDGEEIVDFIENDLIYLTERNGKQTTAFKSYPGAFDMDYSWLCGGRSGFYSYVKSLVAPKTPENCPDGALSKF